MRNLELSENRVAYQSSQFSVSSLVGQHTDIVVIYLTCLKEGSSLCLASIVHFNEEFTCKLHYNACQIQKVKENEHVVLRFESSLRV